MDRIRQTGRLRVGFGPHVIPFSYFNAANDLVGYDIAFAYALARDLGVHLELIPITDWATLSDDLKAGRYDLALGGVYVTDERLQALTVSKPYLQSQLALIVRSDKARRFLDGPSIKREKGLKIATFKSDILQPMARTLFPQAEVVVVPEYEVLLRDDSIDAALWTFEQARAWAAANPGFSAVRPTDFGAPFLIAYLMPPNSDGVCEFYQSVARFAEGERFRAAHDRFTGSRESRGRDQHRRWSIIRNVLHWVESVEEVHITVPALPPELEGASEVIPQISQIFTDLHRRETR